MVSCGLGAGGGADVVDREATAAPNELRAVTNPFGVKSFETLRRNHIHESPVGHFKES